MCLSYDTEDSNLLELRPIFIFKIKNKISDFLLFLLLDGQPGVEKEVFGHEEEGETALGQADLVDCRVGSTRCENRGLCVLV